ncbi:hypothetical protein VBApiPXC38_18 [Acinetobacter phage VB_ApiP_XC38]|uniref:Uncharacterized protein n=1 Tax=Acinetobacter phage VB_ApiP_XC38 TaxID=2655002 RepID=A0A5P8PR23_9CAUD|nr:hypothetical protein KNU81_gp18 [Acinetobacter phage VB_ApiP_XC38]QFR59705.1 hypothetical protein VBApiPXC38_18 [Acinetobacter phage VB_ApiP_XC38]
MQIKFKKQIDIELDRSDLLEAVRDLLAKHGQVISDAELEEVKFINSPQTGIRATLKVTEESVDTASVVNGTPTDVVKAEVHEPQVTAPVEPEPEPEPQAEEPGQVEPSTVEDVMPSVDEIKTMVAEPAANSDVPSPEQLRTSLF